MENDISIHGYIQMGTIRGWRCSVCNAINSPCLQQCRCNGAIQTTMTETWIACRNCGQVHRLGEACPNCSGFMSEVVGV